MATFLAVVEAGSFNKAASHRELSQGAISQQIGKLERQLGARLLTRGTRLCTPTPAGNDFARYAHALMRLSQRAQQAVRQRSAIFGASSNIGIYLLQPDLKGFLTEKGENGLQVRIAANPDLARLLDDGELDAALMEWWDDRPGYESRLWRQEPLVAIAAPGHPWAALERISPEMLVHTPLLGGEPGTGTGRLLNACFGAVASRPPAQSLGSTEAVKQWVKAGLGVSVVMAGTVSADVANGSLRAIPFAGETPRKSLYMVWRQDVVPSSPARQFVDWLSTERRPFIGG